MMMMMRVRTMLLIAADRQGHLDPSTGCLRWCKRYKYCSMPQLSWQI